MFFLYFCWPTFCIGGRWGSFYLWLFGAFPSGSAITGWRASNLASLLFRLVLTHCIPTTDTKKALHSHSLIPTSPPRSCRVWRVSWNLRRRGLFRAGSKYPRVWYPGPRSLYLSTYGHFNRLDNIFSQVYPMYENQEVVAAILFSVIGVVRMRKLA